MVVSNVSEIKGEKLINKEAENVLKKVVISSKDGWDDYVLRIFELGIHGHTPKHKHDWVHINYVLQGTGILYLDGEKHKIKEGSYAYIPENKEHQFINLGEGKLSFICIVPKEGEK